MDQQRKTVRQDHIFRCCLQVKREVTLANKNILWCICTLLGEGTLPFSESPPHFSNGVNAILEGFQNPGKQTLINFFSASIFNGANSKRKNLLHQEQILSFKSRSHLWRVLSSREANSTIFFLLRFSIGVNSQERFFSSKANSFRWSTASNRNAEWMVATPE